VPTHFDLLRQSLRDYEPYRAIDRVLLPYHLLRWSVAWLWTLVWGWSRWLRWRHQPYGAMVAWMWGRHDSPEPVMCHYCLWAGATRECYHGYQGEESEAVDCCPRCDGEI
jgi:hypothetical protein